jgi:hypothetical protein
MRKGLLYVLAAIFLVVIVSVAWWSLAAQQKAGGGTYTVQPGDTVASVTKQFGVSATALADANGITPTALPMKMTPGQTIEVPPTEQTSVDVWKTHLVGLTAEIVGVLMSFWLAMAGGLLPREIRRQVLGISLVLGVAAYSANQGVAPGTPQLTPQFIFNAIANGFAWSAAFPLFARAFGIREQAPAPPPAPSAEPTTSS